MAMNKTRKVSPRQASELIANAGSQFFTVTFVKRSDNELRTMNCRRGVLKGVKGTGKRANKTGLATVYDMTKKAFRNINLSGVRTIKMKGVEYQVG